MDVIRSNEEILDLIQCEKKILKKPPSPKKSNRDIKIKFGLVSSDGSLEYEVFFAQSARFPDDFSLGLMLDKFLLFRCNGFHGTTVSGFYQYSHHAQVHSHTLTLNDIMSGRSDKPSQIKDLTGKYYDFLSAQMYFLQTCGVINYHDYFDFSKLKQLSFSDI